MESTVQNGQRKEFHFRKKVKDIFELFRWASVFVHWLRLARDAEFYSLEDDVVRATF